MNTINIRWDAQRRQFVRIVEDHPVWMHEVSREFAEKHPERFLTEENIQAAPQGQQSAASGDEPCKFCDGAGEQSELVDEASAHMMAFKCLHCSGTGLAKNYPPAKADPAQEAGRDALEELPRWMVEFACLPGELYKSGAINIRDAKLISQAASYIVNTAPAQPAVDLVMAILALKSDNQHPEDKCGLYDIGFYSGANAAAALARAQLEGKS